MASPTKPWERVGVNNSQMPSSCPANTMSGQPSGVGTVTGGGLPQPAISSTPPPLPSRPTQQYGSRYSTMGGYGGGMYSPYSSSMYGSYGGMYGSPYSSSMYGGYGGYGGMGGYNRLGYGANDNGEYDGFARIAEESSRPAFQSIESIVNAFTSVSMMLDSTFQAVYNSFRAVIGVADNFSRLKMQLGNVFSAFALFRFLRYLYRKLLVLLRLREPGYAEEAWTQASDVVGELAAASGDGSTPKKSTWPILMFFGMILGAPWLIWKLVCTINSKTGREWASGDDDHFVAQGLYNFKGESQNDLSFQAGQYINVAPKEFQPKVRGWLLGSVNGKKGLIPANYVKVLGKRRGKKSQPFMEANNPSLASGDSKTVEPVQPMPPLVQSDEGRQLTKEFSDLQSEETLNAEFQNLNSQPDLSVNGNEQLTSDGDKSQMNAVDILNESEENP